jgi:hypothetical protein
MFFRGRRRPATETERSETKTLGDVRIDIVERGGKVVHLKVHHAGGVPQLLHKFSPEVQRKATRFWWSTRRDRRILREASMLGSLPYKIVQQALMHDHAVIIERQMQRKAERVREKNERGLATRPHHRRQLRARSTTALAPARVSKTPQTLTEIFCQLRDVEPAQPRSVPVRSRGR